MKKESRLWKEGRKLFLQKDSLLILILTGVLLLVVVWPTEKKQEHQEDRDLLFTKEEGENTQGVSGEEGRNLEEESRTLEIRLEEILSHMEGVGEVRVMITFASSAERIVEKDSPTKRSSVMEEDSQGGSRNSQDMEAEESTVYIKTQSGEQTPYVVKEVSPRVEGVSVVAKGGADAVVQKNITEVIQALFGIEVHKIKVVKMK